MEKKQSVIMMLAMMVASLSLNSCSNDSDDGSNYANVTTGRKLLEFELLSNDYYSYYSNRGKYKIEYDAKGRMNKVQYVRYDYEYDDKHQIQYYESGEYSEVAIIDYDLRTITIKYPRERFNYSTIFSLNDKGYIDKIGNYTLDYSSNGYLVNIDGPEGLNSLAYNNNNDLIKASISQFTGGKMSLLYVTYENETQGDLYINIKRVDDGMYSGYINLKYIIAILAYQSGLFGKVTNNILTLKDKEEASALFDYETERYSRTIAGKVKFICQ